MTVVDLTAFEVEFQVADVYAARHQAGMEARDHARRPRARGRRHRDLAGSALEPGDRPREVRGRAAAGPAPEPARLGAHRARPAREACKFERGSFIDAGTRAVYVVAATAPCARRSSSAPPRSARSKSCGPRRRRRGRRLRHAATSDDVPEFHDQRLSRRQDSHARDAQHQQDLPHRPDRDARAARLLAARSAPASSSR